MKNSILRLSDSIRRYQKTKNGEKKKTGWPAFRSFKKKWFSLYYDESFKGYKVDGKTLHLSLGKNENNQQIKVDLKLDRRLSEFSGIDIKSLRITRDHSDYFACFCVEKEKKAKKKKEIQKILSIDPNHKCLGYGVDDRKHGLEIKNPYFLRRIERRLDELKSKRDHCQKKSRLIENGNGSSYWQASRRWIKFDKMIKETLQKRRDQTKYYLYGIANEIYRQYDLVCVGDYVPKGGLSRKMRRRMKNESLIKRFKETLSWVAQKRGKYFDEWDERGTTKTCSQCHHRLEKSIDPKIRSWICPKCSHTHLRDENSAISGLKKYFKKYQLPSLGHLEDLRVHTRCVWEWSGLGVRYLDTGDYFTSLFETASKKLK